ncbi:MAG TPA: type I-C CRISPR-associated endonuclease Cas1c [Phycisphaerae bacterium]|nr:type I-C CRISPR-associated endonuclease Cas1c [Phycisphaerae bacterium]
MKIHDNTLYITTQGAYLSKDGTNIVVRVEKQERLRLPIHTIGGIVCFGNVICSPFLLGLCGQEGVAVSFLSRNGRFLARLVGPQSGNLLLRRAQHNASSDSVMAAELAKVFIAAKIANTRYVLQRNLRDHPSEISQPVQSAVSYLAGLINELRQPLSLERIRGIEGDAARRYFSVFDRLLTSQRSDFMFTERSRRPPRDNINSLLSFIYTLLSHDVSAACQSVGLDPQMGFLHADRPGRESLALDMIEELRPALADRFVLTLINRQQVSAKGFKKSPAGGVSMDDKTRKAILTAWQERKTDEFVHPFLNEKISVGLLPFIQAKLLAKCLRNDIDGYPPMIWK